MINKFKKIKGFTLIETLIAVLLLVTAVTGPLTIASRGLVSATVAKDQIVAYYLAQDAIEYVRWVRDTNQLGGQNWLAGLDGADGAPNCIIIVDSNDQPCTVDVFKAPGTEFMSCQGLGGSCSVLYYDNSNGYYTHTSTLNTRTIFRRVIELAPVTTDEYLLTAHVQWTSTGGSTRDVIIQEHIYNWQ